MADAGRPTLYRQEYCQEITEYFDIEATRIVIDRITGKNSEIEKEREVANSLPTIEGFCRKIGVNKSTLHEWVNKHEEFSNAYTRAKDMQTAIFQENALKGLYNPAFSIFWAKNCIGWKDKQEILSENHNINEDITKLSKDELQKQIEEYLSKKNKDTNNNE